MLTCVQIRIKGPSRGIGRLLSNRLSNIKITWNKLSNEKAGLKTCVVFF